MMNIVLNLYYQFFVWTSYYPIEKSAMFTCMGVVYIQMDSVVTKINNNA